LASPDLVTIDPLIANGQPCLCGTPPGPPVLISVVVESFLAAVSLKQFLAIHPHLTLKDVEAGVAFIAAEPIATYLGDIPVTSEDSR